MFRIYFSSNESYTHEILKKVLDKYSSQVELIDLKSSGGPIEYKDGSKTLLWLEYEDLPFNDIHISLSPTSNLYNSIFSCSYCIRKGLIRKAQNANSILHFTSKNPNSILKTGVPETWIFELDGLDYLDEALDECFEVRDCLEENVQITSGETTAKKTNKFILKPSMTNKGSGIHIFDSLDSLENILETEFSQETSDSEDEDVSQPVEWGAVTYNSSYSQLREFVIQRYIDNPLLLKKYGNRKFHIRTYCVAISTIKVYVYRPMLALFASSLYDSDFKTPTNVFSHITNTHVQTENPEFDPNSVVHSFWDLASSSPESSDIGPQDLENIYDQIKKLTGGIFDAVSSQPTNFQPWPNCFEVFGLDFLVDDSFNVFFLEANAYPDFKQTGDGLSQIIVGFLDSVSDLALSEFFMLDTETLSRSVSDLDLVLSKKLRG
ncbi:putative tubulin-tyrosine ligase [Smittium mucronatum]|uniref:Putative tubulin-tyrosine ligase n=1 Tax=Smittium mucronatum TaxID=133383 RepID=A0A1R0GTF1_9FUNG|nr:putative tubulin-tyrosine ligase [Smittium mucronatum]